SHVSDIVCSFFFQAEDGIRDRNVTGVQTCALPIWKRHIAGRFDKNIRDRRLQRVAHGSEHLRRDLLAATFKLRKIAWGDMSASSRSEEHTSELQSRFDLVCRLLLEKKNLIYFSSILQACS